MEVPSDAQENFIIGVNKTVCLKSASYGLLSSEMPFFGP